MGLVVESVDSKAVVGVRDSVTEPGSLFESALPTLFSFCAQHAIVVVGPPIGIYYNVADGVFDMAVALPIDGSPEVDAASMFVGTLPGGSGARATHVGSYDEITDAWGTLMREMESMDLTPSDAPCWEEYTLGPDSGKPSSEWRTDLVQPIT